MSRAVDGGQAFCSTVIKGLPEPIKILECFFGLSENTWNTALTKDRELFSRNLPKQFIEFSVALPNTFVEQIKCADVVYLRGGDTAKLFDCLKVIEGWQEALKDKIIVGSSAGAYVLSEFYVHKADLPELRKGVALAPVKIVSHYRSNYYHGDDRETSSLYWDEVDKLLAGHRSDCKLVELREGEFLVMEK